MFDDSVYQQDWQTIATGDKRLYLCGRNSASIQCRFDRQSRHRHVTVQHSSGLPRKLHRIHL
ncbi:hypothetical protein DPMN_133128 [Dreissena polymorpha]|uniref:Uncharacterized protein n=1 Tax=Dreissena polymorpha TaxID=45954 RepID=A0A9D4FXC8_DREPO|nr:hypothetical protein DPMN_133128 [Dreissena polymorpha]